MAFIFGAIKPYRIRSCSAFDLGVYLLFVGVMVEEPFEIRIGEAKGIMPTAYDQLTIKQLVDLLTWDGKDDVVALSILSGIDYDYWMASKDADIDDKIIPRLAWLEETPIFDELDKPKSLTIDGAEYKVPTDLALERYGQKVLLNLKIKDCAEREENVSQLMPYALAVYFQPKITEGDIDSEKINELVPIMEDLNGLEAYPIASFFLRKCLDSMKLKIGYRIGKRQKKNSLLVLRLLTHLENLLPLTHLHRVMSLSMSK